MYPCSKDSEYILFLCKAPSDGRTIDEVTPSDFVAFYFKSEGFQIHENVWHQPAYPISNEASFFNKQGAVHACVAIDFLKEFNVAVKIDLDGSIL